MAHEGLDVHAYTADLGQPDEKEPARIPPTALTHGAKKARLLDVREPLAREGIAAIQCGAFHLATAGRRYFNTTPLGRAVTATAIASAMKEDDVHIFSDGSTHKGNDIQRFFRYGVLVDPNLAIYKPWLDAVFVEKLGGRKEMSEYLTGLGLPYTMSADKAYSTDCNMLGATHEAKDLERLDVSMHAVDPIMGIPHWRSDVRVDAEVVELTFERGVPTRVAGKSFGTAWEMVQHANTVGGRHGLGTSDQIENRVVDAKSRGIYEAPGMALLSIGYERLLSAIHNENTTELYASLGRKLGRLLYEGRWYDPEACLLKEALTRWVATPISGVVAVELRRGDDYTIIRTEAENAAYDPEKLSMERSATAFTPEDRIGALEVQGLGVLDNRALLSVLEAAGVGFKP